MAGYASYAPLKTGASDMRRRFALAMIAILAVILLFDLSASGALARIGSSESTQYGWASQDFALREAPRLDAPRVQLVKQGTKFALVDSAGGEILDPRSIAPAKWYLIKPVNGGDAGWAYATWISR